MKRSCVVDGVTPAPLHFCIEVIDEHVMRHTDSWLWSWDATEDIQTNYHRGLTLARCTEDA